MSKRAYWIVRGTPLLSSKDEVMSIETTRKAARQEAKILLELCRVSRVTIERCYRESYEGYRLA